jgi:23S rRNA pseudouridine2605 synthase
MLERLQKIISRAGIASRRHAEQLILSGAVTVNGQVVTELGTRADAERDHITVGPRTVKIAETPERYMAFYKPAQVVSTMSDPERRPCLGPYLRGFKGRLFPVGRLDFDAAGLLVLTSDGMLASDLMRAAAVVPQTWRFKVKGRIAPETQRGIERTAGVRLCVFRDAANAWYEAELFGGGPRGRMEHALLRHGVLVEKMLRWKFGGVDLGNLNPGEMRELTPDEVRALRRVAAGRGRKPEHATAEAAATAPLPERPGQAAMARAVEEWRTAHPRRARGAARRAETSAAAKRWTGRKRHGKNLGPGRRQA